MEEALQAQKRENEIVRQQEEKICQQDLKIQEMFHQFQLMQNDMQGYNAFKSFMTGGSGDETFFPNQVK
jgi:hypothetical protein